MKSWQGLGGETTKRLSIPILLMSLLVGCTSNASSPPRSSSATPPSTTGFSGVYGWRGKILVGEDGSLVALTRGFSPKLSPDRTMIAFLRDPPDPHVKNGKAPFAMQVWLIHPDGSGLRKLGQQRGCCMTIPGHLSWSPDGSSIVLNALRKQTFDLVTDESLSMPAADTIRRPRMRAFCSLTYIRFGEGTTNPVRCPSCVIRTTNMSISTSLMSP